MNKIIALVVLAAIAVIFINSNNPFPQFTDEQMEQICIEEGIY